MIPHILTFLILASAAMPANAQTSSPEQLIHDLSAALQTRDAERVLQLFDLEGGGYAYALDGPLHRGSKFEEWLRQDIIETGRVFVIDSIDAAEAEVRVEATYGIGRPQSKRFYLFRISPTGKIAEWRISQAASGS